MAATSLPRITARIDTKTQSLLKEAAAYCGSRSLNAFVLAAAVEKAQKVLQERRTLQLGEADTLRFIEALESEGSVQPKLCDAFSAYMEDADTTA